MTVLPPVAVLIATVATFLIGGAYYAVLGDRLVAATPAGAPERPTSMPASTVVVEVVRCLVLSLVGVGLGTAAGVTSWWAGLLFGLVLWIGFPLVLWTGAVVHEGTPTALAGIHAGDWLLKLLAIGLVVGLWN